MRLTIIITLIFTCFIGFSQSSNKLNSLSVAVNTGGLLPFTDVNNPDRTITSTEEYKLGFGLSVAKSFNYSFSLRGQFVSGSLYGVKKIDNVASTATFPNNQYFNADIKDFNLTAKMNISNMIFPKHFKKRKIYVYAIAGIGMVKVSSLRSQISNDSLISGLGYNDELTSVSTPASKMIIPLGMGLKYQITDRIDVGFESNIRVVSGDDIDAAKIIGTNNDKYAYNSVGVTISLGKNSSSFDWVSPYSQIIKNNDLIKQKIMLLSRDTDYDGVVDYFDKEPETPEGATVDYNGRTLDTDNDGVPDYLDMEVNSNEGAIVDSTGVERDVDNDGVGDIADNDTLTPLGAVVNFKGESVVGNNGGSVSNQTTNNYNNTTNNTTNSFSNGSTASSTWVLPSIFFDISRTKISNQRNYEKLATVAQLLRSNTSIKVKIIGYADQSGGANSFNDELSKKRAETVFEHLTSKYLIDPERLIIVGQGSTNYLSTDEAINRRVEFEIIN